MITEQGLGCKEGATTTATLVNLCLDQKGHRLVKKNNHILLQISVSPA